LLIYLLILQKLCKTVCLIHRFVGFTKTGCFRTRQLHAVSGFLAIRKRTTCGHLHLHRHININDVRVWI